MAKPPVELLDRKVGDLPKVRIIELLAESTRTALFNKCVIAMLQDALIDVEQSLKIDRTDEARVLLVHILNGFDAKSRDQVTHGADGTVLHVAGGGSYRIEI